MSGPASISVDPNSPTFDHPDYAASALSKNFGTTKSGEHAGVIFQRPDGKYVYSTVTPQSGDTFSLKASVPSGYKLAGIVHSHPGDDDDAGYFSPTDVDVANQLKLPSYIRFLKDDSMRKFVPGVTKTQRIGGFGSQIVAQGDPISSPPPPSTPTQTIPTNNVPPFLASSK